MTTNLLPALIFIGASVGVAIRADLVGLGVGAAFGTVVWLIMGLGGRLRCWLTGKHDRQWVENYGVAEGEVEWCPRCTRIWNVRAESNDERG